MKNEKVRCEMVLCGIFQKRQRPLENFEFCIPRPISWLARQRGLACCGILAASNRELAVSSVGIWIRPRNK